jgi:hypothetical protein
VSISSVGARFVVPAQLTTMSTCWNAEMTASRSAARDDSSPTSHATVSVRRPRR